MSDFNTDFSKADRIPVFYKKVRVEEIEPNDSLIQVVGYAKNINASQEFSIDDKTGKISVRDIPDEVAAIQENRLYRIFGELSMDGVGSQFIKSEIVQDVNDLNFDLYQKSLDLSREID
jgi:hypothetical protein